MQTKLKMIFTISLVIRDRSDIWLQVSIAPLDLFYATFFFTSFAN